MTKKEVICNSIMKLSRHDICDIEKSMVVSLNNFVVLRINNAVSVDFEMYSYNTKVAALSLISIPSKKWILHLKKDVFWSNTTRRDVSTAVDALLDKIGNNARINIYTKNGVINATSTNKEDKIKIIIE